MKTKTEYPDITIKMFVCPEVQSHLFFQSQEPPSPLPIFKVSKFM